MPKWSVFAIGAAIIAVISLSAAVLLHQQQVHREQIAVAEARFKKLDSAHSVDKATQIRFLSDYRKMDADYTAATKASTKRHDRGDSLNIGAVIALARTERTNVEALQTLQRDIEASDQKILETLASLYGSDAVAKLRQDMADRNEARDNSLDMWWRAAQSIEDNAKAAQNGEDSNNSSDEIVRDYDESAKDQNHAEQLQLEVDRESNALEHRLTLEWRSAKRALVALGGG